jgi:hypothetical protein
MEIIFIKTEHASSKIEFTIFVPTSAKQCAIFLGGL